jgi:predicted transcriptional regulator
MYTSKSVSVTIRCPVDLLERIDRLAHAHGVDRTSWMLSRAAEIPLEQVEENRRERIRRGRKRGQDGR